MLRHIIWDFDGTLFDTYPSMAGALFATLREHGYNAPYEEVYSLMKQSVPVAFDFYAQRMEWSSGIESEYAARRRGIETAACTPYPGAAELSSVESLMGAKIPTESRPSLSVSRHIHSV